MVQDIVSAPLAVIDLPLKREEKEEEVIPKSLRVKQLLADNKPKDFYFHILGVKRECSKRFGNEFTYSLEEDKFILFPDTKSEKRYRLYGGLIKFFWKPVLYMNTLVVYQLCVAGCSSECASDTLISVLDFEEEKIVKIKDTQDSIKLLFNAKTGKHMLVTRQEVPEWNETGWKVVRWVK